jgi:hypothetical protein
MPIKQAPIRNSASRFQPSNRLRTFNTFNDGDFDEDDGFRRFNDIIVFDTFAFPFSPFFGSAFFPFYYPYPYYPYGYGGYGYQGGYDGYGYQSSGYGVNGSLVVQVQRRLASAGYYSGPIDGVIGSGTRRAIRAYERSHGLPIDGQIHRRLLATMGLA